MLCEMHTHGSHALKYFFQSYLEGLLEKRKWQLKIWCKGLSLLWKCWQERLAGQGRAGLVSTGVQCVDWSCYDGHRPDPIRWYHQPPASQPGSSSQNSPAIRPVTGSFRGRNNDSQPHSRAWADELAWNESSSRWAAWRLAWLHDNNCCCKK